MTSRVAIALAGLIALAGCAGHRTQEKKNVANLPQEEIRDLSYAIKAASTYRADMRNRLDSIEDSLNNAATEEMRGKFALQLSVMFRPINTDSSLNYAYRAKAMAETLGEDFDQRASIAVIDALSTAGLFTEATGLFDNLGQQTLGGETQLAYWIAGRRLYGYMREYAKGNADCYNKYDSYYKQYDDSLLKHLPAASDLRAFLECEHLVSDNKFQQAKEKLEILLARLPQENNIYGMAAFQMAEVWLNMGNENQFAAMLAKSALSDVKGCVTEGMALPALADFLYKKGELGEAFAFINFALEEASAGNARMRAVTIAQFVPVIDEAYRDKINSSRDEIMIYLMLVTILLLITAVLIVFLVRQVKESKANAKKLSQTSRRQESYIGNFIGLYSSYAAKLNRLTKLVSTKLAAGQGAELKKLIDSGRFTDNDNDDIHKIFDIAFLDIYPDFVDRINALLRPEEAIKLKGDEILTPELRIYAFVKLGIDESTKIAQILHYSINTVYTYRNKMRNRAINRDTFDLDVKSL